MLFICLCFDVKTCATVAVYVNCNKDINVVSRLYLNWCVRVNCTYGSVQHIIIKRFLNKDGKM